MAAASRDFIAGILLVLVMFAYSVSFSALIFSGRLSEYAGLGVVAALVSAAIATVAISRLGSFKHSLAGPDTPVVAILSALAIGIASSTVPTASSAQVFSNVVAGMVACACLTGLILIVIGGLHLSQWVRFVPYTVLAGFLAASGWFLISGAMTMLTGQLTTEALLADIAYAGWNSPLAAATFFGFLIFGLDRLTKSSLVAPVGTLVVWLAILAALACGLVDRNALQASGWLLPNLAGTEVYLPISTLFAVPPDLHGLILFLPEIISVAGVATFAILLNTTGLEVDVGGNANLDRDFLANGLANIACGVIGGLPSNVSLNRSIMVHSAGGRTRLAASVVAFGCIGLSFVAVDAAAVVPTPLLGGLLFYMGATMLWRWLVISKRRFTWPEYASVVAIFGLIVAYGYIAGAALGVVASCMTFAFTYSRTAFVRQHTSRQHYASYVKRSRIDETLLHEHGQRIQIFWLQGYIFFGTAHQLAGQISAVFSSAKTPLTALVLDFSHVTGADSSASFSLIKILRQLQQTGTRACFTGLSAEQAIRQQRVLQEHSAIPGPVFFERLELGLEWCEEQLLQQLGGPFGPKRSIDTWMADEFGDEALAGRVVTAMTRQKVPAGGIICRQGEPSDSIIFVASGRVSIFLEPDGSRPLRLRTMLGKTVIGEIGFYQGRPRGASVIADEASEVLVLSRAVFDELAATEPLALEALHQLIIRILGDRLNFANHEVAALQ